MTDPRTANRIFWILIGVCVLLAVGYAIYVMADAEYVEGHVHYSWETWFGFYGIFGFLSCVVLVVGARVLRAISKRDEDFYDR